MSGAPVSVMVLVEHDPSPMKLEVLGVDDWSISIDAVSVQEKTHAHTETHYILRGRAEITPQDGQTVVVRAGDLVTCMPDARCRWKITEALERHHRKG